MKHRKFDDGLQQEIEMDERGFIESRAELERQRKLLNMEELADEMDKLKKENKITEEDI